MNNIRSNHMITTTSDW